MVSVYVMRHGETLANQNGEICGRRDIPLTQKGIDEINANLNKIRNLNITKIIASPLVRAQKTAEVVANDLNLSFELDERLTEFHFGEYDGLQTTDTEFLNLRSNFPYRFNGGESLFEAVHRVYSLMDELMVNEQDTILLVCHNAIARVIHSYKKSLSNSEFFEFNLHNGECVALKHLNESGL